MTAREKIEAAESWARNLGRRWPPAGYTPKAAAEKLFPSDSKASRISFLKRKREATKADLLMKFEDQDWHGVQDCGSDLRDIDSELAGLRY